MVKPVDAVHSGCSGIVVYGGKDIVFGAKRSNQWMQYTVDAVDHHIPLSHCIHCIHCVMLHPLFIASTVYCVHWFDLFAPPPYTTIPLHTLCTAYCILHPLCPLVWPFCVKDNVPTTMYHYSTASTAYCILRPLVWPFLYQRQGPYHHIWLFHCVLCPLCTAFTASTGLTIMLQRQCPHQHIPLFHCILHQLRPLVWAFCTKDNFPTTIYHYSTVYCVHSLLHPLCTASTAYCIHCVLCPLGTVSTASTACPTWPM